MIVELRNTESLVEVPAVFPTVVPSVFHFVPDADLASVGGGSAVMEY